MEINTIRILFQNIDKLRNNAISDDLIPHNKDKMLKPNLPGLNIDIIKERMGLKNKYSSKLRIINQQEIL